jgi:hypothetical protein
MGKKKADGKPSNMSLVREAVEKLGLDAKPEAIRQEILASHNIDVPTGLISTYKSIFKREKNKVPKKAKAASASSPKASKISDDAVLEFIATVRNFESKVGAEKILQVMNALYKQSQ